jgi:hypothetical protein
MKLTMLYCAGNGRAEGESLVLAHEVVRGGVAHLDSAVAHGVIHTEGRHDFTRCSHRDGEPAACHRAHLLGKDLGSAVNGVQRLGEAGGEAPAQGRLGMNGRRHAGGKHACQTSTVNE